MIKLFQILALLALAWFAFGALRRAARRAARPPSPPVPPAAGAGTTMVPCARCGLHVPEPEAIRRGDRYYCSRQHALEGGA